MMQQKEKIVVFSSREICYNSSSFFANQMADAFEKEGFEVSVCEFTKEDDLDAILTPLYGKKYRLLLDFNSAMSRMVEDDGTHVLDLIDGPFYDYILDHPLFHYNCLNENLNNLNAIFVDEAQEAYVKHYYPNVKNTLTMPLGATEAVAAGTKKKQREVLFMGTFDSPDIIYEMVMMSPEPLQSYMKKLIDMRLGNPVLPMEDAFKQLLSEMGTELSDKDFALYMNAMYPVDVFIRDYFRKAAIDELTKNKIPVRLIGDGWQKYKSMNEDCVTRESPVVFGLSFEKIAQANILLNVSPFFNHGAHDRIFAGMANHCVVLTDENPYLEKHFTDGEELCMYSLSTLSTLSDYAAELLEQPDLCSKIQDTAYRNFREKYTWQKKAQQLLACTFS